MSNNTKLRMQDMYQFTNTWHASIKHIWDELIEQLKPVKILEIGSAQMRQDCFLTRTRHLQSPIPRIQ